MFHDPNQTDWTSCPEGALTSLGSRLHDQQRREQTASLMRTVAACSVLIVAAVGAIWWMSDVSTLGGITCAECHNTFDSYHAHLTGAEPMDDKFADSMQAHLDNCPKCRSLFEKEFPAALATALNDAGRLLATGDQRLARLLLAHL